MSLEILYALTVFLSAFLLFQIQPMIAKMILPWFGGVSTVWSTCMLFFQVVLLGGYGYAHWLQGRFSPRREAWIHSGVLALSLLSLPVIADPSWKPSPTDVPSLRILGLLAATVGLPYFVVSTTSSLLQSWYARTHAGAVPYRLFALSNFASMLALLTYPVLVEPAMATRTQAWVWSAAYACFAVLCAATVWSGAKAKSAAPAAAAEADIPAPPFAATRVPWVALAACASILLLAVTNFLTQDVAALPFLWIVPLAIYLLSFILCFSAHSFYRRSVYIPLAVAGLVAAATRLTYDGWRLHMIPTIGIFAVSLFAWCMFCHGEVVARKPHPRYLTGFYVMISLGGAVGGLFVGLLAPNFFNAYYEFPIGLALCAVLVVVTLPALGEASAPRLVRRLWRPALALVCCGYLFYAGVVIRDMVEDYLVVKRNFYGELRVNQDGDESDEESYRVLVHGQIDHGRQMLNEKYRRQPVTYFCADSGIGRMMKARPERPQRMAVLGMGCGTLAAYGRPGDTIRIYEINPLVPELVDRWFTYVRDSPAKVEVVLGDARLALEREPDQKFDLLVMDAFSGDSVPVHLITREAIGMYLRHLTPGGWLAVNISNRYLNLRPVMERVAANFGKIAVYFTLDPPETNFLCHASSWVLIADPSVRQTAPELVKGGEVLSPHRAFRMWTDDFSSMWGILR